MNEFLTQYMLPENKNSSISEARFKVAGTSKELELTMSDMDGIKATQSLCVLTYFYKHSLNKHKKITKLIEGENLWRPSFSLVNFPQGKGSDPWAISAPKVINNDNLLSESLNTFLMEQIDLLIKNELIRLYPSIDDLNDYCDGLAAFALR